MPATMPPKMITEMPLPMPFSVISSPIQTRNIVPAVIENSAVNVDERLIARERGIEHRARRRGLTGLCAG